MIEILFKIIFIMSIPVFILAYIALILVITNEVRSLWSKLEP